MRADLGGVRVLAELAWGFPPAQQIPTPIELELRIPYGSELRGPVEWVSASTRSTARPRAFVCAWTALSSPWLNGSLVTR
jgi:hypothetical protein